MGFRFTPTEIPDVILIEVDTYPDHREFFRDKPAEFDFRAPGKLFIAEYAKFIASRNELLGSANQLGAVRAHLAR